MIDVLAQEAISLGERGRRGILGITGPPGVGKTTLVELLIARITELTAPQWLAHIPMDGFHLADRQLARLGLLHRKGAPATFDAAGYAHTLARARVETENPVYAPGFERTLEQPIAAALAVLPAARLVVTEGNYLLLDDPAWKAARREIDTVWYVTSEDSLRIDRLVARHVEFGKTPDEARAWVTGSDQPNADLVATTYDAADRLIVNGSSGWELVR